MLIFKPLKITPKVDNHEYMHGSFSIDLYEKQKELARAVIYNPSFRHAPIHPDAPKMIKIGKNKMKFVEGKESLYRRLSVRELREFKHFQILINLSITVWQMVIR